MLQINLDFEGYPSSGELEELVAEKLEINTYEETVEVGLWEEKECTITHNAISSYFSCSKHSEKIAEVTYSWKNWNSDKLNVRTEIFYKTPLVLVATNEGGNATTGVCLSCVKELELKVEKKLPSKAIVDFSYEYHKGRTTTYKHLRFGQAFLNKFYPDLSCPEIYYEIDEQKAAQLIVEKFVDLDGVTLSDILWRM